MLCIPLFLLVVLLIKVFKIRILSPHQTISLPYKFKFKSLKFKSPVARSSYLLLRKIDQLIRGATVGKAIINPMRYGENLINLPKIMR